ncbi:MAG: SDR family oxidoreductase [Alphaproteobacteria bacterium]|nr:SDR family oxidoreductase [Alphaproteobacteria bacterium]
MSSVLITGANRGIGLEFARQYAAAGWRVIATCRDPDHARSLVALGVEVRELDVTNTKAIQALASSLAGVSIDLLINNAGVYGNEGGEQVFGHLDAESWIRVFQINTIAAVKMAEAFLPHLLTSRRPVIANLSSKMGSIDDNTSGGVYLYRSSKAALNAVSKSLAIDLGHRGILVVVLHPGWVKTDMGGPQALISAEVSVQGMRDVIARLTPADSGRFLSNKGDQVPW